MIINNGQMIYRTDNIEHYEFKHKKNILPIIINGKGGVGKDTFIKIIQNFFSYDEKYEYLNLSTIDQIKEIAASIGMTTYKNTEGRKFLSDLKKLIVDYNSNYSYNYIMNKIAKFDTTSLFKMHIFFIHCREINEIKMFKEKLNAITLLITRSEVDNIKFGNDSDDFVDNYDYDFIITNNSKLLKLQQTALAFVDIIQNIFLNK
jgi:hypothetical protein